jgi:hypothetical protein
LTRAIFTAAVALLLAGVLARATGAERAAPAPNAIQRENSLPGTTAWQARQGGDIALYGSQIAAAPGDELHFHVSTANRYRIVVYRLGWYGGDGARLLACLPSCTTDEQGQAQPALGPPPALPTDPPIRANWPVTDVLHTGSDWASGYYLTEAVLTSGPDTGAVATTYFVVHEPASTSGSRILVQVPVNTWQAYNQWGGKSLYDFFGPRMYRVSFERPFGELAQSPLWWEIQLVRFLEREGYDVSYQTDADTDRDPSSLLRHRLVMVAGHDEYWTSGIRDAFDTALADGTNLAFMGANEGYWRIKYEDDRQTLFSYKSLYDPTPVLADKTALFRDIGRPECMIEAVQHQSLVAKPALLDYTVTAAGASDPWLAGTGLRGGDTITGAVSREHDKINPYPESCFHPGLVDLLHYDGGGVDSDADAVRFTAPSGARVFSAGSFQLNWALDDWRSDGSLGPEPPTSPWQGVPVDPRVQQLVRNMLKDLQRPAPPTGATVHRTRLRLIVSVPPSVDPRVTGFVAAVRTPSGWRRLCHGRIRCAGLIPLGATGPLTIGIVYRDLWHAHSVPFYVVTAQA